MPEATHRWRSTIVGVSEKNPKVRTVRLDREPLGLERAFLPAVAKGLALTTKRFFSNTFLRTETQTIEYPEERPVYPERYRGLHRLMTREDGSVRCVACMMCPTVCPAHCITIHPGEREDTNEKYPVVFEIDELRCVVCGLCVEACPCDAIRMDTGVHMHPVDFRGDAVLGKIDLMKRGEQSTAVQGGHEGNWKQEDGGKGERGPKSAVPAGPR
jgi:NADH-quinone oxidoreductase subunit I